jgi:hypothetical protein
VAKTGVDIKFLETKVGAYVFGGLTVKATPEVETLASQAMIDQDIRAYLRCVQSRNTQMTLDQVAYFNKMDAFFESKPTPKEWLDWHRENPFPNEAQRQKEKVERNDKEIRSRMQAMAAATEEALRVFDADVARVCAEGATSPRALSSSYEGWNKAAGVVSLALAGNVVQPRANPVNVETQFAVPDLKSFDLVTVVLERWKAAAPNTPMDSGARDLLDATSAFGHVVYATRESFGSTGGSRGDDPAKKAQQFCAGLRRNAANARAEIEDRYKRVKDHELIRPLLSPAQ